MSLRQSIGLIEVVGLANSVAVLDTMLKAANIQLVDIEKAKGSGWMTIKIEGNVSDVKAAIDAGEQIAKTDNSFVSKKVIARPAESLCSVFYRKQAEQHASVEGQSVVAILHDEKGEEITLSQAVTEEVTSVIAEVGADIDELDHSIRPFAGSIEKVLALSAGQIAEVDQTSFGGALSSRQSPTCNICKDLLCTRKKGEPRANCINNN